MKVFIAAVFTLAVVVHGLGQTTPSNTKPLPKPEKPRVQHRETSPQKQDSSSKPPVEPKNTPSAGGSPEKAVEGATKRNEHQNNAPELLYRAYLWATIIGVGVALVGLGFVYWQIKIGKQTAEAAKASADALINIERPWLLVSHAERRVANAVGGKSYLVFKVTNYGNTPAEITDVGGGWAVFINIDEMPKEPEYGHAGFYNDRPIPKDQQSGEIVIQYDRSKHVANSHLIGFGFIKYRGAFAGRDTPSPYVTRFSYCFTQFGNNPCGLPGYNSHT